MAHAAFWLLALGAAVSGGFFIPHHNGAPAAAIAFSAAFYLFAAYRHVRGTAPSETLWCSNAAESIATSVTNALIATVLLLPSSPLRWCVVAAVIVGCVVSRVARSRAPVGT